MRESVGTVSVPLDVREAGWVRVALTAAWIFFIAIAAMDVWSAYQGRLMLMSAATMGPMAIVAAVQGIALHGWMRRIASWALFAAYCGFALVLLSLFMFLPPRWFPVVVWWIVFGGLWGLATVWWRGGMRTVIIAWCLIPVMLAVGLFLNGGKWRGDVEVIPVNAMTMAHSFAWIGEGPEVFVVTGSKTDGGSMRSDPMAVLVGSTRGQRDLALDRDWELISQRRVNSALLALVEHDSDWEKAEITTRSVDVNGFLEKTETLPAYGVVSVNKLKMVETHDEWSVFPRLIHEDDEEEEFGWGVTFLHRETGEMIHVEEMEPEWMFPTDDPVRFHSIRTEMNFLAGEDDEPEMNQVLVLIEFDLSRRLAGEDGIREMARHDLPYRHVILHAAHPSSGVFFEAIAPGRGGWFGYDSVEYLDWKTGEIVVLGEKLSYDEAFFSEHDRGVVAFVLEKASGERRLKVYDGVAEPREMKLGVAEVIHAAQISPDARRVAIVVGRGFLPGDPGEVFSCHFLLAWDLETGRVVQLRGDSIFASLTGRAGARAWGSGNGNMLWSRDSRRLAVLSSGMTPFDTDNTRVSVYDVRGE